MSYCGSLSIIVTIIKSESIIQNWLNNFLKVLNNRFILNDYAQLSVMLTTVSQLLVIYSYF